MEKNDLICEDIINLLDYCYHSTKEDDLGGLLGAISENIVFADIRADEALYNDMKILLNTAKSDFFIDSLTIAVLEHYQNLYGFKFAKTIDLLKSLNQKQIRQILDKYK